MKTRPSILGSVWLKKSCDMRGSQNRILLAHLVDVVTLPLAPVHQVLKHGDAERVLQVPGAKSKLNLELLITVS